MDDAVRALIKSTFDAVAATYDSPALRFFSIGAGHLVERLGLRGDEDVLDLACGTGHVTSALASRLPRGHVTAVDFVPSMLAQARAKVEAAGLHNVDFVEADMQDLPWRRRFDVATCAFGIFFVEDMDAQLRRIADTVKPGGRVAITNFAKDYMEPQRSLMMARLRQFGVEPSPQTWLRIGHADGCRELFEKAGLVDITVEREDLGYPLARAEDWWEVIWNAGFRRLLNRVPPADQPAFKTQHLAEIDALRTPAGIPMPVPAYFTTGVVAG